MKPSTDQSNILKAKNGNATGDSEGTAVFMQHLGYQFSNNFVTLY